MKDFKRDMFKKLVGLFIVAMAFISMPQQAEAFTVNATNTYGQTMYVAILNYVDIEGMWYCHGWQSVAPNSTRSINIENSTQRNFIYVYAYTSEASFSGAGIDGSVSRVVIGDKFGYYDHGSCPEGRNRRTVSFAKWWRNDNGDIDYTP